VTGNALKCFAFVNNICDVLADITNRLDELISMRFLQIILMAFALLTVQGVSASKAASMIPHGHGGALTSANAFAVSQTAASSAQSAHHHFPHHCAQSCENSAQMVRVPVGSRDIVKSIPVRLASYLPSNWSAIEQVRETIWRFPKVLEAASRRNKNTPFKGIYARTARQRL